MGGRSVPALLGRSFQVGVLTRTLEKVSPRKTWF